MEDNMGVELHGDKRVKAEADTVPGFELIRELRGHKAAVTRARYSPDCSMIASCSDDGTVKIWDAQTGELKHTFEGHERGISDLCWVRDSRHVGTVSDDKTIRVWSIAKEKEIRRMRAHTHHIVSICFNHKGNLLATGGADENVLIWDTLQGKLMKTLAAHADPVSSVLFSHDGTILASASHDGLIRIWDSGSGHCLRTLVSPERSPVMAARFSPNGRYLLSSTLDGRIRLWDILNLTENNKCVKTYRSSEGELFKYGCSAGFITHNSRSYIVQGTGEDGYMGIWDVQTKKLVDKIKPHDSGPVLSIDDVPSMDHIVSTGSDGTIKLWKVI